MKYTSVEMQKEIPIYSGEGISKDVKKYLSNIDFDKVIIITDSTVYKLWAKDLSKKLTGLDFHFFTFRAGEKSKNFKTYQQLCDRILDKGITKKSLIIAFGGGVTGNISGFIAATLFRGIKFIHIPTTILAQADSSTGGKQAINSRHGKNTIGTFYEPEFILIDSQYLSTLSEREILCGIAECIKHALCQDEKLLKKIFHKKLNRDFLLNTIQETIQLKLDVIEKDRTEINEGKVLVYGHTIGHAIETLSKGKLNHGESISVGMCCVAYIAHQLGYLSEKDMNKHFEVTSNWGLPTKIPQNLAINTIIKQLDYDKKFKDVEIELVILEKIGKIFTKNNKVGISISDTKCY